MDVRLGRPYAYRNQSLVDHIIGCLKQLDNFLLANPNYMRTVCARLANAEVDGVELKTIEDALRLGILTHDLGKAYRLYQEKVEKYGGGFEGHEILSAASCYKIVSKGAENRALWTLLLMAVLNHHQAFRENIPKMLDSDSDLSIRKVQNIAKNGLCDSVMNLEPILREFGLSIEDVFARDYSEFESILKKIRSLLEFSLRKKFDENRRWLKLYSLLMFPMVLADNLDASEKRDGPTSNRLIVKELRRAIDDE